MKKLLSLILLICILLLGCERKGPLVYNINKSDELREYESESAAEESFEQALEQRESLAESERAALAQNQIWTKKRSEKTPTRVKGIYLTANTAGTRETMTQIIQGIDATEINAVVIDVLGDSGHISYRMDNALVQQLGVTTNTIPDMPALMAELRDHHIYTIARIVTFRDPYLESIKPEWLNHNADGTVFHDNSGMAWVDPYNREAWEYKVQVAESCADLGFDEVQFDYVRFCTEKGMNQVVYPESETGGKGKTEIITEFVRFASDRLAAKDVFMSTDVFGTIIGSYIDTVSVGQDYTIMAEATDYMCPMIYPSHYGNGNFGLDVPDLHPYEAILGACNSSVKELRLNRTVGSHQAVVRPWLQGFTASYLGAFLHYGPEQVRQEIQAVYDAGYDEWLVWNAANNYDWTAFYSDEQAAQEDQQIAMKRGVMQETAAASTELAGSAGR